jgi:hypothetical protein
MPERDGVVPLLTFRRRVRRGAREAAAAIARTKQADSEQTARLRSQFHPGVGLRPEFSPLTSSKFFLEQGECWLMSSRIASCKAL